MHSQAVPSLLEALRTGTALLHVALEKRLPFFCEQLDANWYQRLLQAYYGFYGPMEAALYDSGLIPDGFDTVMRVKTPTLLNDLRALQLTEGAIHALPRCTEIPTLDSPAACLGALYVLEGATLGGQVLRREMALRLDVNADNGGAFLDVYGAVSPVLYTPPRARERGKPIVCPLLLVKNNKQYLTLLIVRHV
ncbi:biliverdin-producing heme oxygenase [Pseudomonas syringae]|uniref:biliverdin-producing heme oxygenase n=1 Tax=Pseudomonas syringae TaxID=317 RepID=UPI001F265157|nr:biliverdin-producing heme oxygenase [Pseudomonas syringae]MCF5725372.1 biliverdin-producing heme oxygenase [Pseudomonas syringae]